MFDVVANKALDVLNCPANDDMERTFATRVGVVADIDGDGKNDIAVSQWGAPDDRGASGSVYLYSSTHSTPLASVSCHRDACDLGFDLVSFGPSSNAVLVSAGANWKTVRFTNH